MQSLLRHVLFFVSFSGRRVQFRVCQHYEIRRPPNTYPHAPKLQTLIQKSRESGGGLSASLSPIRDCGEPHFLHAGCLQTIRVRKCARRRFRKRLFARVSAGDYSQEIIRKRLESFQQTFDSDPALKRLVLVEVSHTKTGRRRPFASLSYENVRRIVKIVECASVYSITTHRDERPQKHSTLTPYID